MSNLPCSEDPPPTIPQVTGVLQSVLNASQQILETSPGSLEQLRNIFKHFVDHPTSKVLLGSPPQPASHSPPPATPQWSAELASIKDTLSSLSKAVKLLQPNAKGSPQNPPDSTRTPSAQGKGQGNQTSPTYATKAMAQPRPSLVLDFNAQQLKMAHQSPDAIHELLNAALADTEHHQVHISATRWTGKGNLVLTGGLHNTAQQLLATSATIKCIFTSQYDDDDRPLPHFPIHANVKWSKLLINGVPTGVCDTCGAKTPDECHAALISENPAYAALPVTQKPSWVCPPSTYTANTSSSLVVAFEDPDGSRAQELLSSHQLYIFGTCAKVKCWKTVPPKPCTNTTSASSTATSMDQAVAMELEGSLKQVSTTLKKHPLTSPTHRPKELTSSTAASSS
ncbi:hypothetical protein BJV78DRAFT_1283557 [Lactifluus subvellereus]|nr:hypothetical protein BJV78DRAFT_1283557 [Lactifluus subvellereus]